jgi:hypothetical protein
MARRLAGYQAAQAGAILNLAALRGTSASAARPSSKSPMEAG